MSVQVSRSQKDIIGSRTRQPRLLVVDDESETALAFQLYLTRQGYKVSVAYNGEKALEMIQKNPPDLLVLDLNMPRMSGL